MSRFLITLLIALAAFLFGLLVKSPALIVVTISVFFTVSALGVTFPQMKFFGPFICEGSPDNRTIALTFDDGPDPDSTMALLDLLREQNVPAAFFCIGKRIDDHPEVASRIVKEGHLLENHSYSHSNFTNVFMGPRLRDELERTRSAIEKAAGSKSSCFRPPMGLSNALIFKVARALNFRVVGWSARGLDTITRDPERIVNRIIRQLKPGGIILLHDGNIPAGRLVLTVKTLLDRVHGLGYEVVRLDRLIS